MSFSPVPGVRRCAPSRGAGKCGEGRGLQNPLSLFPRKKRKRLLMVSREKGWAAAFRASPGTLAAPFTGVLAWWGLAGLCPFNHIWKLRKLGVFPDAPSFSFAAAPWRLRKTVGRRSRMPCRPLFAAASWRLREIGGKGGPGCSAVLFLLPHPGSCG